MAVFRKGRRFQIELSFSHFIGALHPGAFRYLKENRSSVEQQFGQQVKWDDEKQTVFLSWEGDIHVKTFRRVGLAGFIALILLLVGVALLLFFGVK